MAAYDLERAELREKNAEWIRQLRGADNNSVATQMTNLTDELLKWKELAVVVIDALMIAEYALQDEADRDPSVGADYLNDHMQKISYAVENAKQSLEAAGISSDRRAALPSE